ncbi:uromodulin-like 1 isoform X3 [Takifugu flavidus]|uniref:uromodulin-like 1 isoform X3 n=1 Tax=Takifugu flavidus TaxID=433684 RepID=UPI0025447027|nr:uromodulin-like 1 isoform X3 [Takifugu flavidus]
MRGGGRQSHRGLGLIYTLAVSKCVLELVIHEKMSWMFSIWAAGALLTVCRGQDAVHAGPSLSASGYHLCVRNTTRTVTFLAVHKVPFSVTKPCGGWLLWKTCTVTEYRMSHQTEYKTVTEQETSCCQGYVRVGRYCTAYGNGDLCARPGSCPATNGSYPGSKGCRWDGDCPGWQKCCQGANHSLCSEPTRPTDHFGRGRNRFNATVIVKTDYKQLVSEDGGLLNHTRLLQTMVWGALQSNVSIHYLDSWPVYPYRTATALLLHCPFDLLLHNVTSKLHLLLKDIEEVLSVTVEDIDECELPTLHRCPPLAGCNNTLGSYQCICPQGFIDIDPSNPGTSCKAEDRTGASTEPPTLLVPTMNTNDSSTTYTVEEPQGSNTTDNRTTAAPSPTGPVLNKSSQVPTGSTQASTTEPSLQTAVCPPPSILRLWSANVTGSSFSICWSSQFHTNQMYVVEVLKGTEVHVWQTHEEMMVVLGRDPGELYTVVVTPCACGSQGSPLRIAVRTDALTLGATARLTNIQFNVELQDASTQAYTNLTGSILAEIHQALPPEVKAMWESEQVRVEVRGFSPGSVVAHLTIIFTPSQSQDIINVTAAVLQSLMNSTKYSVDPHSINVTDFDECSSGDNDCSLWATCTNTWASYTCVCLRGFKDADPERPGRACQAANTTFSPPTSSTDNPASAHSTATRVAEVTAATAAIPATSAISVTSSRPSSPAADTPSQSTTVTPTGTKAATTTGPTGPERASTGAISVQCRGAAITVSVVRDFLLRASIRENALYLGSLECGINGGNATHVQLTVGWNECDTKIVHNESHYMASVTLFNTMDQKVLPSGAVEAPKVHLEVPIVCAYVKSMLISADFSSTGYEMLKDVILGSGSFLVRVQLMNGTDPLPHNYSVSSDEVVVVDVSLNTSLDQIKVVINRCWATSTQNPGDTYSYIFLENSCSLNKYTKVLSNGNSSTSRVSVQIFSFVDLSVIYLHCQVQICAQIGSDSCVPDCLQRTSRSSDNTIATTFGSSGPLLKSNEETLVEDVSDLQVIGLSCLGVGLCLFFIIGFICLFYYQRNRIGHYNFSTNPKEENFTSLATNT